MGRVTDGHVHFRQHVANLRTACVGVGAEAHFAFLPDLVQRLQILGVIVGLLLLSALVGNALATASIVTACIERGCCLDDEATLASCRATGFPNATGV